MNIYKKLIEVQSRLKAPKNQYNSFGKYNYRSAEDILEAVKPLLKEVGATMILRDEIIMVGERYYVKTTAKFIDIETGDFVEAEGVAREEENKKGMDASQLTGSTASYSLKRCLGNLYNIDDTKDSDTTNTHGKEVPSRVQATEQPKTMKDLTGATLTDKQVSRLIAIGKSAGQSVELIKKVAKKDYGVEELNQLSKKDYDALCDRLEKIKK